MSIAFSLLLICIVFVSGATIHDGSAVRSLLTALILAALVFVGISARAADVKFVGQATKRLKLAVAIPAIWMIIQILPIPFGAHSIWSYASEALDREAWGHISIDYGGTILAVVFYLANLSLVVVCLFVTKDRKKAELVLLVLTGVTATTTLVLLVGNRIAGLDASDEVRSAISSLGLLLSLTCAVRAFERHESGRKVPPEQTQNFRVALSVSGVGFLCCLAGLATSASLNAGLIALLGIVVFGSIQAVRRVGLASWATAVLVATMIIATAMTIVWRYDSARAVSPFLQFTSAKSAEAISVTQRLVSDAGWQGTGAGTFEALVPMYRDLGGSIASAPSTTSAFAVELGWPMTLMLIAIAMSLVVTLYRGALARGRDSFYPAAAAACGVVMLGQAFCDASLLNSSTAVLADAIIGLGLAQSISARNGA